MFFNTGSYTSIDFIFDIPKNSLKKTRKIKSLDES